LCEKIKLESTVLQKTIVKQYCSVIEYEMPIKRTARWTRSVDYYETACILFSL
jgi:hypothetical protein